MNIIKHFTPLFPILQPRVNYQYTRTFSKFNFNHGYFSMNVYLNCENNRLL